MKNQLIQKSQQFLHERVGKVFGAELGEPSLLGQFCFNSKTKGVGTHAGRVGSAGAAFILADSNRSYVYEKFVADHIPGLQEPGHSVTLIAPSPDYGFTLTVATWLLDIEARSYPLIAILPTKRSSVPNLRLTELPEQSFVTTPDELIEFDAVNVRKARDALRLLGADALLKWRSVAALREDASFLGNADANAMNLTLKKLAEANLVIPPDVWLPQPNTGNHTVLAWATSTFAKAMHLH